MGLTTDPDSPCLRKIESNGQQACYLVLSEEERAKGFIRPVRRSYTHVRCGSVTTMGQAIAETYARDPKFYGGTFCCNCGKHFRLMDVDRDAEGKPTGDVMKPQFLWDDGSTVGS